MAAPHLAEAPLLENRRLDISTAVALAIATAVVFALVAWGETRGWVESVDEAALRSVLSVRSAGLTLVARALDDLGSVRATLAIRIVVAGYLGFRARWWHLGAFLGAIVASEAAIGVLKPLYDRERPPASLVATTGASFPSGHAVAASATAVALVIVLLPPTRRAVWGGVAVAFSFVMALSRVYLAAHWLSDAFAGTLLGTTLAVVVASSLQAVRDRSSTPRPSRPGPGRD